MNCTKCNSGQVALIYIKDLDDKVIRVYGCNSCKNMFKTTEEVIDKKDAEITIKELHKLM